MSRKYLITATIITCATLTTSAAVAQHIKLDTNSMNSDDARHKMRIAYLKTESEIRKANYGQTDYTFINDPKFTGPNQAKQQVAEKASKPQPDETNYGQTDYTFLNDPKFIGIYQGRKELLAQQHAGEFDCFPCDNTIRLSEAD